MNTTVSETFGLLASIIALAGLSMLVMNAKGSATLIGSVTGGLGDLINAATHPGGSTT
jgi:hypothetical protein